MDGIIVWIATHQVAVPAGWHDVQLIAGIVMGIIGFIAGFFTIGGLIAAVSSGDGAAGCVFGIAGGIILGCVMYMLGIWALPAAAIITAAIFAYRYQYYRRWQSY